MRLTNFLLVCNLAGLLYLIRCNRARPAHPLPTGESKIMFIVKDDNPSVGYRVTPGTAVDAEGNEVSPEQLTVEVVSSDPDIVAVQPDPTDGTAGTISFGKPGDAAITATVSSSGGIHAVYGAQFHITTGDPASISGGSIAFDGLTEAEDTTVVG
jgi:hypothetical protein